MRRSFVYEKCHFLLITAYLCHHTIQSFRIGGHRSGGHHLLIVGLGRVGTEIAQNATSLFSTITGTVRHHHPGKEEYALEEDGIGGVNRISFHNISLMQTMLPTRTHILITVPPPRVEPDPDLNAVLESIDQYFPRNQGWIGLISTTGVYGNHQGAWVTEESTCYAANHSEQSNSARRFWQWEKEFQEKCDRNGHQLAIFRCAGIYGPGRSALHTVFKEQTASEKSSDRPSSSSAPVTNRIHSQDLVRAVVACMQRSETMGACEIFNLADDLPESRSVVLQYARDMLQSAGLWNNTLMLPPEPSSKSTRVPSNRARRRETEEKRVSNARMKDMLLEGDHSLLYPTYKEGLEQIFRQPTEPWWKQPT